MILLEAVEVSKRFKLFDTFLKTSKDYVTALDKVSFQLKQGRCLGIVGESGSGKSTLARIIANIIKPDSGIVKYKGIDINDKKIYKEYRKNLQIVFQDPYSSLNPRLTVYSVFADIIKEHITKDKNKIKNIIVDLMKKVGLEEEHIYRYPNQFSGGQRQRIAIARSLILDPEIIIADEPISALDVSLAAQILNLLKKFKQEGKTIILIAHDLAVVKFICDDIIVLRKGVLVEKGSNFEIFSNPKSEYTRNLINASLLKEKRIELTS